MLRCGQNLLRRASSSPLSSTLKTLENDFSIPDFEPVLRRFYITGSPSSSPSLSIWRRKKEMGKEGLIITKELKRLQSNPVRFDRFMKSHVSRLLKSDLVAVLAEFQRQDLVFLSMKEEERKRNPDIFWSKIYKQMQEGKIEGFQFQVGCMFMAWDLDIIVELVESFVLTGGTSHNSSRIKSYGLLLPTDVESQCLELSFA